MDVQGRDFQLLVEMFYFACEFYLIFLRGMREVLRVRQDYIS